MTSLPIFPFIIIYRITNLITNKLYVGQTEQTLKDRFVQHKRKGNGCLKLVRSMNKHGRENFVIEFVMAANTQEVADYWEQFFIAKWDCIKNGYNIAEGGKVTKHSAETKKQMSETHLKKSFCRTPEAITEILEGKLSTQQLATKYNTTPQTIAIVRREALLEQGIVYKYVPHETSEQTRQAISKANTGSKRTQEARKRMSDAQKGKKRSPEHIRNSAEALRGMKHTEQSRENMMAGQRARWPHRAQEAMLDIQTSSLSIQELASKYNVDGATIYNIKREARPADQKGRRRYAYQTSVGIADICSSALTNKELAVKYGCVIETISRIKKRNL